jgi:hypothetical protein
MVPTSTLKTNNCYMKKIFLALLTLIVLTSNAQVLSPNLQNNPKISTAKLALIDSVVNQYVKNRWLIGAL